MEVYTVKGDAIIHLTGRVRSWHMRSFHQMAAPILTKMKLTQTGNQVEQICCGLPPMNSVTPWVLNILMCVVQLCILIIRDTLQTCNSILTTSTAFDPSMVLSGFDCPCYCSCLALFVFHLTWLNTLFSVVC